MTADAHSTPAPARTASPAPPAAADGPVLVTGAAGFAGSHLLDLLVAGAHTPHSAQAFAPHDAQTASHAAGVCPAGAAGSAAPPHADAAAGAAAADDATPSAHAHASPPQIVGWHHPSTATPATFASASAPGVRWQAVDLADAAAVHRAIAEIRPSAVYHLAGAASQGKSWAQTSETLRVNVLGTAHLFDALRDAGLQPRTVVISSASVYRPSDTAMDEEAAIEPASPYGLSKLAQERVALQRLAGDRDVPAIVVRAFNHIGPRQGPDFVAASFARQLAAIEAGRHAPVLEVGNLDAHRDLMDVRDTVRAYQALMRYGTPDRIYNVCAGRAIRIRDLLDELVRLTRVRVEVRLDPARLRPSDQPVVLGRHDRLTRDTGWTPAVPMAQTLADLLDYWRARESGC